MLAPIADHALTIGGMHGETPLAAIIQAVQIILIRILLARDQADVPAVRPRDFGNLDVDIRVIPGFVPAVGSDSALLRPGDNQCDAPVTGDGFQGAAVGLPG